MTIFSIFNNSMFLKQLIIDSSTYEEFVEALKDKNLDLIITTEDICIDAITILSYQTENSTHLKRAYDTYKNFPDINHFRYLAFPEIKTMAEMFEVMFPFTPNHSKRFFIDINPKLKPKAERNTTFWMVAKDEFYNKLNNTISLINFPGYIRAHWLTMDRVGINYAYNTVRNELGLTIVDVKDFKSFLP
jgi:hypothetical protein